MRKLNPEGASDNGLVRNHGGMLWVLGVKHEGAGIRFGNDNGGQTQVCGMFNRGPGVGAGGTRLIVHNDNSPFCHAVQTRAGRIALQRGIHPFTVGFQQGAGEAVLRVDVEGPDGKRRPLGLER